MFVSPDAIIRSKQIAILLGMLLWFSVGSSAQSRLTLNNDPSFKIENYEVLPDAHYSIGKLSRDTSIKYLADSLNSSRSDFYWIRLHLYNPYPNKENYLLSLSLPLNYTLFYLDAASHKMVSRSGGPNGASGQRIASAVPCILQKQADNILYLKVDLRDLKAFHTPVKPVITMVKEVVFNAEEGFIRLSYLLCCIVLISFTAYNLYIYFYLKDSAYLYYVVVQIGALLYYTGFRFYFNLWLQPGLYNLEMLSPSQINKFDINMLFVHVGVIVIFCGFIQFTRAYLCTRDLLPKCDRLLKIIAYAYLVVEAVPVLITISGLHYVNNVRISNLFILVILSCCIATGIIAYRRNIRAASHFLAANILPVLLVACTSVYILLYDVSGPLLPETAILSQILTFAVALVARIKMINDDLKAKAIEAVQLEADVTIADYQRLLTEQENKHITLTVALEKEKNELLQQRLEANQRELVGNSLYIHQKSKLLADLKTHMDDIDTLYPHADAGTIKNIKSSLKGDQYLDEEWDKFKLHFEQVHPSFFKNLQAEYPMLTKYELRLYAYFHINLSTKEIAALLNIAPASVRQAKARLNKKMNG